MLFNFRLTPLEFIHPFGTEGNYSLHWFGLSDGCYWLRVGEAELYRASQLFLERRDWQSYCDPYVDYFVVRFWEDLLEILPVILVPVPEALHGKLAARNIKAWQEQVYHWFDRQEIWQETKNGSATEWMRIRRLYSSYLRYSPNIWLWSDETHVHIEWDSRDVVENGIPVWEAQLGSYSLSREAFLSEVRAFHEAFMSAMQARVDHVLASWDRPEIAIDRDELIESQAYRQAEFDKALALVEQGKPDDWAGILEVAALIEADTDNSRGT